MSKKFLDADGLTYLVSKLDDYPTNEILAAVIDGIDEVKQDKLYILSNHSTINNITLANDKTAKGVAPYNTTYYYTNITVDTDKVNITDATIEEGTVIGMMLSTAVSGTYRNVRIRFGETGTWHPCYVSTGIMSGSSYLGADQYRQFVYSTMVNADGAFHLLYDSNTTYSNVSFGNGYGTCATAEATTEKAVTLASYNLAVNSMVAVKFTYAVPASATMNINSKGAKPIFYQGSAITDGIIAAGDTGFFIYDGTNYNLLTIDKDNAGELVELSTYNKNDVIPAAIVAKLQNYNNTAHYADDYYRIVTDTTVSGTRMVLFAALNSSNGGGGFYISLADGATDWIFSGAVEIAVVGYDANNILNIKLNNTNKCFNLVEGSNDTEIRKNSNQSGSIILTLPATTGTIALTSDITAPTYAQIIAALGYTPYSSANPNSYISSISSSDVTTALGYTPYNATNPNNYITGITGSDVTTALGYTPYNSTNPNNYITGISSSDVTTALGYTPYNATNPNNYITATTTALNNYYSKTEVDGMVANRFQALIVSALPTSNISTSTIYMIQDSANANSYDEWMYISDAWTKIGSTSIDMSDYAEKDSLHNVAFTGAYNSLVGKPTIPDDTSDLTNSAGFITNSVNDLVNYTATADLATVATTGDYDDLLNTPTIPTAVSQLTNDSNYLNATTLRQQNVSSLINDANYATLSDIQGLENIDVDEINSAIAAMQNIGTVTSITAGAGLTGGTITTSGTIAHSNSVTAVSGYASGTTLSNGGSFTVRDVQYDAQGHITGSQDRTITMAQIPAYDDTTVRGLISAETTARTTLAGRVDDLEDFNRDTFTQFVFCTFGIEPYIDPSTLQPVADRYYLRSDTDTGIYLDNNKIDIHLKAWLKYHYGITTLDWLKNVTVYLYAMGDHGEYVNHMVTFWSQMNNSDITSYPDLQQVGMFIDDGYGSVHRFTSTQLGVLLSSSDDGYIQADPLGTGKGFVSGWNTLTGRVSTLEDTIGDIDDLLDEINGEVV